MLKKDGLLTRPEQPVLRKVIEQRGIQLRRRQEKDSYFLDGIPLDSRVIIIEGISGSGKDTFQAYLKEILEERDVDVYDYSEGEVLHAWKQMQIEGICSLRIAFMKLFVNYVRDVVNRDENAVFLLNRFHLSTYASTIIKQPKLEKKYDEMINVLRTLPVHVFILQVDEDEIEKRILHPERSGAWFQKYRRQMVTKDGFRDRLERYLWQQRIMLEASKRQQIPYSVIKLSYESKIGGEWVRIFEAPSIVRRGVRMNAAGAKISRGRRHLPPKL